MKNTINKANINVQNFFITPFLFCFTTPRPAGTPLARGELINKNRVNFRRLEVDYNSNRDCVAYLCISRTPTKWLDFVFMSCLTSKFLWVS